MAAVRGWAVLERLTEQELTEFARVFRPGTGLASLLARRGLPIEHLPAETGLDAVEFWSLVDDRIANGIVADGRRLLLAFAAERYPANPVFAAGLAATNTTPVRTPVTSPEPTPPTVRPDPVDISSLSAHGPAETASPETALRRVCFLGAGPDGRPGGPPARELLAILTALRGTGIEVVPRPPAAAAELAQSVGGRPDVLHLSCRTAGSDLHFRDAGDNWLSIPIAGLAQTLRQWTESSGGPLDALVLAASDGRAAAEALRPFARTVIAHSGDLADEDAIVFAGSFYRALGSGIAPDAAARSAAEQCRGSARLVPGLLVITGAARPA